MAVALDQWKDYACRQMARSREATLRFIMRLPERLIAEPRTQGEWSIKDVLAHLVAWEEEAIRRLDFILEGQADRIVFYEDRAAADAFNALAVGRLRRTSLGRLLHRMARTRARLTECLHRLPLARLNDPSHRHPVIEWFPEFAWTHEQDHLRRMQRWWYNRSRDRREKSPRPRSRRDPT
jgi:hypothetical protein